MHEIITLQFGEQANYLCTHFWNTQESYFTYDAPNSQPQTQQSQEQGEEEQKPPVDHNISFRPGLSPDGTETFTPRNLIYDFTPSFGALRKYNELYDADYAEEVGGSATWPYTPTPLPTQTPTAPHPYQLHLTHPGTHPLPPLTPSTIHHFTDLTHPYHHPTSIQPIPASLLGPAQKSFTNHTHGTDLLASLTAAATDHDILDAHLRPHLESADHPQGLQLVAGVTAGWAGWTSAYLERLRDELPKYPVLLFGVEDPPPPGAAARDVRSAEHARALTDIAPLSSLYVPLAHTPARAPSYVTVDPSSPWHTTAPSSLAVETVTLPTRLKPTSPASLPLHSLLSDLESPSRPAQTIAELRMSLAGLGLREMNGGSHPPGRTEPSKTPPDMSFFPFEAPDPAPEPFSTLTVSRGAPFSSDPGSGEEPQDGGTSIEIDQAAPILPTFPTSIFPNRPASQTTIPVQATLVKSPTVALWSRALEASVRRRVAAEEREGMLDGLRGVGEAYSGEWEDDQWDGSSDE